MRVHISHERSNLYHLCITKRIIANLYGQMEKFIHKENCSKLQLQPLTYFILKMFLLSFQNSKKYYKIACNFNN